MLAWPAQSHMVPHSMHTPGPLPACPGWLHGHARTGTEVRSVAAAGARAEGCRAGALSEESPLTGGTGGQTASGERQNSAGKAAQLDDLLLRFQVTSTLLCAQYAAGPTTLQQARETRRA